MKRPSIKIPLWATLFCFLPFLFALLFRSSVGLVGRSQSVLQEKFLGGLTLGVLVWAVYGIVFALRKK
jgi:hypothetical protein